MRLNEPDHTRRGPVAVRWPNWLLNKFYSIARTAEFRAWHPRIQSSESEHFFRAQHL